MSTDGLGYVLVLLVIGASFICVRYRNILLSLGTAALWATLLSYVIANVTHSNMQEIFIMGIAAFICAFALIGIITRRKGEGSISQNFGSLMNRDTHEATPTPRRGLMDLSNAEYKAYIRTLTRWKRR